MPSEIKAKLCRLDFNISAIIHHAPKIICLLESDPYYTKVYEKLCELRDEIEKHVKFEDIDMSIVEELEKQMYDNSLLLGFLGLKYVGPKSSKKRKSQHKIILYDK